MTRDETADSYIARRTRLVAGFDGPAELWRAVMPSRFSAFRAFEALCTTCREIAHALPHILHVGGDDNRLTSSLVHLSGARRYTGQWLPTAGHSSK